MEKLRQVISYILSESPNGRGRVDLCKLIYYLDGVFFQRHAVTVTGERFLHRETSPEAFHFSECIASMTEKKEILVELVLREVKAGGFHFKSGPAKVENFLLREEKRIINKVLKAFPGRVLDENRFYPNLYENYVITPVYSEIPFSVDRVNTKIRYYKQKNLLTYSGKIFKVLFED